MADKRAPAFGTADLSNCDRELIQRGCEMLGLPVSAVAEICIEGMKPYAEDLGLTGTEQ